MELQHVTNSTASSNEGGAQQWVAAMRNGGGTCSCGSTRSGGGCFGRDERSPCAGADVVAVSI